MRAYIRVSMSVFVNLLVFYDDDGTNISSKIQLKMPSTATTHNSLAHLDKFSANTHTHTYVFILVHI